MNSRQSADNVTVSDAESFRQSSDSAGGWTEPHKLTDRLGALDFFQRECQLYEALLAYSSELTDLSLPISRSFVERVERFREALSFIKVFGNELRITIAGESRVGKSTLTRELDRFFKQWSTKRRDQEIRSKARLQEDNEEAPIGKVGPSMVFVEASPANTVGSEMDNIELIEPHHLVSDLHIVVLSVEGLLTGTELSHIDSLLHDWGRNVVVLINKIDLESSRTIKLIEERINKALQSVIDRGRGRPFSGAVLGVYFVSDQFPETLSEFSRTLLGMFGTSIVPHIKRRSLHRLTGLLREIFSNEIERIKFRIRCEGVGTNQEIVEIKDEAEQVRSAAKVSVADLSLFGRCVAGARDRIDSMVWWRFGFHGRVVADFVRLIEELEADIVARFDKSVNLIASKNHVYVVSPVGYLGESVKELASIFQESKESVEKAVKGAFRRQFVTNCIFLLISVYTAYVLVNENYGQAIVLLLAAWLNRAFDQSRPRLLSSISRIIGEAQNAYIDIVNDLIYRTYDEGVSVALADKNRQLLRQQNLQDKLRRVAMMVLE